MEQRSATFVGVRGTILALDSATGSELWRATLKAGHFVNVAFDGQRIIATTRGEVFALDPATGHVLWNNPLPGLGWGFVTIAGAGQVPPMALIQQNNEQAASTAIIGGAVVSS